MANEYDAIRTATDVAETEHNKLGVVTAELGVQVQTLQTANSELTQQVADLEAKLAASQKPPFQIWDSTASGYLVAQGFPRLKCPSEQQFFPDEARGAPNVAWLMTNAVPNMAQYNPLSIDVEAYGRKATATEPPYTEQDIQYLCTIVQRY
jgi:hypothetical protein